MLRYENYQQKQSKKLAIKIAYFLIKTYFISSGSSFYCKTSLCFSDKKQTLFTC